MIEFIKKMPELAKCRPEYAEEARAMLVQLYEQEIKADGKSIFAYQQQHDYGVISKRFEIAGIILKRAGGQQALIDYITIKLSAGMWNRYAERDDKAAADTAVQADSVVASFSTADPAIVAVDDAYEAEAAAAGFWGA